MSAPDIDLQVPVDHQTHLAIMLSEHTSLVYYQSEAIINMKISEYLLYTPLTILYQTHQNTSHEV